MTERVSRTIAISIPHRQGVKSKLWRAHPTSVGEIKKFIGYGFFSNARQSMEGKIETKGRVVSYTRGKIQKPDCLVHMLTVLGEHQRKNQESKQFFSCMKPPWEDRNERGRLVGEYPATCRNRLRYARNRELTQNLKIERLELSKL